ncbi:MAG: hypothetical protein NTW10_02725 [Bacteroidetes bacterium]|nr:hypothetical protein [Bacteroidota bacterium]
MKQKVFLILIILTFQSCTSSKDATSTKSPSKKSEYSLRDGTSYEKAIIIFEKSESVGVHAEYEWLNNHYPGYKAGKQALTNYKKKPYDVISITTTEGKELDIFFDISNFYGKF